MAFHYGRVATAPSPPPLKRPFAVGRKDKEDKISKVAWNGCQIAFYIFTKFS